MEGKTFKRFDGLFREMRELQVMRKARKVGALTIVVLLLIGLFANGVFPRTILGETGSANATRLWSSGAELNSLTANMEITGSSGTVSISSSTMRSGDYAFRANPTSGTGTIYKTWANSAQSNKFWFRQYIRIATAPGADTYIMQIGNGSSGKISVRLTSSSTLQLRNEEDNANIGSASSALSTNTWYRLEVYVNTTTLSTTVATMLLDGTQISTSSSENLAAGVDRWTWGVANSTTADLFFDDLAVNNSSGRSTDNWPGEGKIVHMQPDADGDNTAWGGYPSDTNDYDDVDEVTPNDSTDFIRSTTQNQLDDVNLESSSNAGMTSGDYVKLVSVGARFEICGTVTPEPACLAGSGDINYKTRIKASASGTTEESVSTGIDDLVSGFVTNNDDTARLNALTIYDLPGTSTTQWTTTNLDSAQIGIRNDDVNGTGFKMTAIWLQVEYVPLSGGRLISSGLELNSATAGMEFSAATNSPAINSSTVRSGSYSLETENGGGQEYVRYYFESADSNGNYYGRAYFRISTSTDIFDATIMSFLDTSNLQRAAIKITSSNTLKLYDEDSQIGSASSALSTGTWYRIELRIDTTGSSGSHIVDGRIDGTSFASSTTRSIGTGVARLGVGINASDNPEVSNNQGGFLWDDIAVNKGSGTTQNTWPGAGKIIHLRPNATGSVANWTTNGTCTGGNYACSNEVTPNDATNYVSETTSDNIDEYNIDDSPIDGVDTVNLVSVGVRFRTSSATQEDFKVRVKDSSTGIAIESTILSPASTTWTTNATADPKLYPLTAYTRPELSTAWTDTELDTAQIGLRDVLSSSGTVHVTAMWLLVDYSPPPPINIQGTCDQYDQTTDCTDDGANEIAVAVNGSLQGQVDTTVDGSWQISGVTQPNSGDVITVFINGETTDNEEAVAVTKYDGSGDITGVVLFYRHLTIGSADNQTVTNSDLSSYDNSVSGDEDIFFDVSVGNDLTVDSLSSYTDEELYIVINNTFRPASGGGADVTTVHVENDGTWTADSNAINLSGSWQNDGTFTAGTSTTTFTSTTSGRTLSGTLTGTTGKFYDLVFNGSGGAWTLSANCESANDFTVTLGTFSTSGTNYSLTVGRDLTIANSASASFTANGSTITVSRHWDKGNSGGFTRGTSTVNLAGTGEIRSTGGGFTQFHNLEVATTSQTTTMAIARTDVFNTLTVNAGIMTCSVTCEFELFRTSGTDLVINGSATLSGSNATFHLRKQSASTISLASGNYGTWHILLRADTTGIVTFNMSGSIQTTGTILVWAASGGSGSNFNTQNNNLTAKSFSVGHSTNTTAIASNFGSSTVTLENGTSDALFPVSNGGSHTLNLSSSSVSVKGNVKFANGTGTFTITPGSSTLTWTNTSGTLSYVPNAQSLFNVVLTATGATVQPNGAVDVDNDFTINGGTFDTVSGSNHALTVDRDFTLANSAGVVFTANNATITVTRHFNDTGNKFSQGNSTVTLNGTGTLTGGGGRTFYNLNTGYTGFITTISNTNYTVTNQLTFNGGETASSGSWLDLPCSSGTCTRIVFNAATTLSGSRSLFFQNTATTVTSNIPAGNYGTWNITAYVTSGASTSSTYSVQGGITTTSNIRLEAANGSTGNVFNTNGNTISASYFDVGNSGQSRAANWSVNFGASAVTLTRTTSLSFGVNNNGGSHTVDLSSATFDVKSNVTFVDGTGTFTITAGTSVMTWTNTSGTATYTPNSQSLYDVTLNGSGGTVQPAGAVDINNNLTMSAGTLSGTQNIEVNGHVQGTAGIINLTGGLFEQRVAASKNFGTTSGSTAWTFNNLRFSNGSVSEAPVTITTQTGGSGGITVNGTLTQGIVTDVEATDLNAGNRIWTLKGSDGSPYVIVNGGAGTATLVGSTSTFEYRGVNGGGDTTIEKGGDGSYNHLDVGCAGICGSETYVLEGATVANGNLTIQSGQTLDVVSGSNFALTVGGSYLNSGTFTARNGAVTFSATSTGKTLGGTMTGSSSFYDVIFNGSGGGWTLNAAITASRNFDITNGTFDTNNSSSYAVTVSNNFTGNSGTWSFEMRNSTITVSGNWDTSAIGQDSVNLVEGGSNVVMNGSGTKTIKTGATNVWEGRFHDLTVGQSGNTTQLITNTTGMTGTLFLGTGTFDLNSRSLYINSPDATPLSLNPSGTWGTGNGALAFFGSGNYNLPAFTYNSNLVTEQNTGFKTTFAGTTTITGNVTIGCCSRASEIDLNGQTVTVNGDITFNTTTAILTMGAADLTVKGNWVNTNNAVFNANTGKVTLGGTATQTLSGTMTGSSSFYDLTITNSSGTDASDCERTGFVPSIDFAASATATNNFVITTASARVEYNSGSTYTFNNINWNGQGSGTRIYFRNSLAGSGTWLLNVSGTQTAVSYVNVSRSDASGGNQIIANDGTNINCGNNTNWLFNTAPNSPTSLVQKRVTAGTTISTGGWTNETQVKFEASASDTDNPDTLQLCVEADILADSFSNTEDLCGSGVAYSGSPVTVSVTITGLTDASEYHWQARVKDSAGAYSSWVSYDVNPETERDFGIDTTACVTSIVYDGDVEDTDAAYNDGSLTALSANWDAFSCGVSGLNKYEYSVGTTVGGTDIKNWTDIGTNENFTATSLVLRTNQTYFANVRAIDNASNTSSVYSSNGQYVLPTISLTLGSTTITFSNLNDANNRTDTKTLNLTTSTNAYGGYVIRQYATGVLTNGSFTIPMFQGGTYASPGSWPGGFCTGGSNCGYGYTSNDTTIQGSNKFSSGTLYASFATAAFGDIIADHTDAVTGATGPVTNEAFTITHKVAVDALQAAKNYQTEVLYIVTGTF